MIDPETVLKQGLIFKATINVLEGGQVDVEFGGILTSETLAILSVIFEIKKRREAKPPPEAEDTVDGLLNQMIDREVADAQD